jgi:tRNA modification GTPase
LRFRASAFSLSFPRIAMHSPDDTIAAIATAAGAAARGIVRISGPDAISIAARLFSAQDAEENGAGFVRIPARNSQYARAIAGSVVLSMSTSDQPAPRSLPCTLYLWPTARSYTRQPVAELHTIGSPPLLAALLRAACLAGARLAEPGEFTLRAFLAGRLDLMQAEAVLGVIDAADRRQLDVALTQLAGGLSGPLASLRDDLLNLLADLEAGLDFTEEDLQFISAADLRTRLTAAAENVRQLLDRMQTRTRAEFEPRVALVGWPNVGKSSLFNALLGRSAALVSDSPGTTRDYLTAPLPLGDLRCRLTDTAGRESFSNDSCVVSDAAQQATMEQAEQADVRVLCLDATRAPNAWEELQLMRGERQIAVLTKCDAADAGGRSIAPQAQGRLPTTSPLPTTPPAFPGLRAPQSFLQTSSATGVGLDALKSAIRDHLTATAPTSAVAATATRCHESLRLAAECLSRTSEIAAASGGEELIAAETRASLVELGKVVGTIYTDDILARIFSRFCIGK